MAELNFRIDGKAKTATQLNVAAREFSIVVDEPPALGGGDNGANPVEYLLAGYAGCLNVVAHITAKELGIELEGLSINVNGDIDLDRFLGNETRERAGFKGLTVDFIPVTSASDAEISQWIEQIEKRCPINDNLSNPTPIKLNIVNAKVNAN